MYDLIDECVENFEEVNFARRGEVGEGKIVPVVKSRIPLDVFDGARDMIYRLMKNDSYVRWQASPGAKVALLNLEM